MIIIDEKRIFEIITEKRPASVALNGPEGLVPQVQQTAQNIMKRFGIPAYVIADATWGTCDLNSNGAKTLAAELLFNIGHTINTEIYQDGTYLIDAFDDISFDSVAGKCAGIFGGKRVSLTTDSQHLHQIDAVRKILEKDGLAVTVGSGGGQLRDGQVFGCEFYPATKASQTADVNLFLGQSNFHAAGIALATGMPTYVLDPYFDEIRDVTEFARDLQKKATLAVYKAADAQTFGVIVGLKEGQISKTAGLKFKKELENHGKTVHLFAMTDITNQRLVNLKGIDAFVQVACPRISTDNQFDKPVLSTPQANALLRILEGQPEGPYMQTQHWL